MKIRSKDISVVIQGAVNRQYIENCLKSVRKYLPDAELILSTWKSSDVTGLDYDKLLLNDDPGAEIFTLRGEKQNQNRQILSTKHGIQKATRKYVLKMRSDMKIMGTNFLNYFGCHTKRNSKYKILKERILINSLYTRDSEIPPFKSNFYPFLFHVSDWVMFGLREDLLNIWDIDLAPEPETSRYFINHPTLYHDRECLTRWHAEQYIWLSFLKKNGVNVNYDNYQIYNEEIKEISEISIVNNTFLLEYKQEFDILCQKYPKQAGNSKCMHPLNWFRLYKKYCDSSFEIPLRYNWKTVFEIEELTEHLQKHYKAFVKPVKKVLSWSGQLFSIISYSLKIALKISKNLNRIK